MILKTNSSKFFLEEIVSLINYRIEGYRIWEFKLNPTVEILVEFIENDLPHNGIFKSKKEALYYLIDKFGPLKEV